MLKKIKRKLLVLFSYIVSLSTPKALTDAVNAAASVEELDGEILDKAGFWNA